MGGAGAKGRGRGEGENIQADACWAWSLHGAWAQDPVIMTWGAGGGGESQSMPVMCPSSQHVSIPCHHKEPNIETTNLERIYIMCDLKLAEIW